MANSFMWLVDHGRPATAERLNLKEWSGQPGARVVKEGGRFHLLYIIFHKGINPFLWTPNQLIGRMRLRI